MSVYPFYSVFILSLSLFYFFSSRKYNTQFLYVVLVMILGALFVGFRGADAGSDTINYVNAYNELPSGQFHYKNIYHFFVKNGITAAEPGFVFLTTVIKYFELPYAWYLTAIAFVSLGFVFFGYSKLSPKLSLVVMMYVFSISFISLQANVLRQALSIGMFLISIAFLYERKYFKYVVFGGAATLFHISALPVIILTTLTFAFKRHIYYFLGILGVLALVLSGLINIIFSMFFSGVFLTKIQTYFDIGFSSLTNFKFWSFFLFYGVAYFISRKLIEPHRATLNFIILIYFCCFISQLLFMGDEVASERFGLYRFVLEPLILSFIPLAFKQKVVATLSVLFLTVFYGFIVYNLPSVVNMLGGN